MDPLTLIGLIAPLFVQGGKALISKYIAPDVFKPSTVAEYAQMKQLDLDLFKAMNEAGGSNPSYPWVEAIVRLQRPLVCAVTIGTWAGLHLYSVDNAIVDNFAATVAFYLFGDRTLFYSTKGVTK